MIAELTNFTVKTLWKFQKSFFDSFPSKILTHPVATLIPLSNSHISSMHSQTLTLKNEHYMRSIASWDWRNIAIINNTKMINHNSPSTVSQRRALSSDLCIIYSAICVCLRGTFNWPMRWPFAHKDFSLGSRMIAAEKSVRIFESVILLFSDISLWKFQNYELIAIPLLKLIRAVIKSHK